MAKKKLVLVESIEGEFKESRGLFMRLALASGSVTVGKKKVEFMLGAGMSGTTVFCEVGEGQNRVDMAMDLRPVLQKVTAEWARRKKAGWKRPSEFKDEKKS